MIFYHIDRNCLIKQTGILLLKETPSAHPIHSLFPGISIHGEHYLEHGEPNYLETQLTECALEYIRNAMFPNMPSRFQCLFASSSLEETLKWANYWELKEFNIVKIKSPRSYELDCSWFSDTAKTGSQLISFKLRDTIFGQSLARIFEEAVKYWSGERSCTPRLEVLLPLPCEVVEILSFPFCS